MSRSRKAFSLAIAACVVLIFGGCAAEEQASTDVANTATGQELISNVKEMYQNIFTGDYSSAYEMRSIRCNQKMSRSEYGRLVGVQLGGYKGSPSVDTSITTRGPDRAVVESTFSDKSVPKWMEGPRRWSYIEGNWRFDNCD